GSGEPVTAATQFKQGSVYHLLVEGEDNYRSSDELRFDYRLSADGGLTYLNNWAVVGKIEGTRTLVLPIDPRFTNTLTLVLRADDGKFSSQRRLDFQVVAPSIGLGSPGFTTDPS